MIDANGDGIITAQELQNFTDTAASKGLAEAGAMAALLGGTATYAQPETGFLYPNNTVFNENPDQPAALQRRFNYFDYLANGQLQGGISISSFKMLANTLLPQPDSYVIVDRQRASANGFLVAPLAQRNFVDLQHLLPKYMFVPPSAIKKYRNLSPLSFGVNKNEKPGTALPFYSLFGGGSASVTTGAPVVRTATTNGQTFSVSMVPLLPASSSSTPTTTTTTPTTPYVSTTPTTTNTTATTTSTTPATASTTPATASTTPLTSGTTLIDDDAGCPGRNRVDDHLNNRDRRAGDCRRGNPARERTECVLELAKQPGARRNLDAGATDHLHDFRHDRKYQHRQHHHCEPDDDRGKYHDRDADHDRGKYHDRNADHDGHPARHRIGVSGRGKYHDRDANHDRDADHDRGKYHDRDADHDGHPGRQPHRSLRSRQPRPTRRRLRVWRPPRKPRRRKRTSGPTSGTRSSNHCQRDPATANASEYRTKDRPLSPPRGRGPAWAGEKLVLHKLRFISTFHPRNKNTRLEIVSPAQSSPVMLGVLPGSPRKEEARPAVSTTGGRA